MLIKCLLCGKMIKIVFLLVESRKNFSVFKIKTLSIKNLQIDLFFVCLVAIVAIFANNWLITEVVVLLIKCLLCGKMIIIVFLIIKSGKKFLHFQNYKHPQLKICKLTSFYLGLVTIVAIFANSLAITEVVVVLIKLILCSNTI